VPKNINTLDSRYELVFDICMAPRPAPSKGSLIEEWSTFPHLGKDHPDGAQVLMGDLSLQYRHKNELTLGYKYISPVNVYW
jgi:hypothetical protein